MTPQKHPTFFQTYKLHTKSCLLVQLKEIKQHKCTYPVDLTEIPTLVIFVSTPARQKKNKPNPVKDPTNCPLRNTNQAQGHQFEMT